MANWLIDFFSRRFTSFRFSWGFFSLFFSIGTFGIVLTDRFKGIGLLEALVFSMILFTITSIIMDITGIRGAINYSESNSNPRTVQMLKDLTEIRKELKEIKERLN